MLSYLDESGGYFKYKDIISTGLCVSNIKFGKFFKENGGVRKNIKSIYYLYEMIDDDNTKNYKLQYMFSFLINNLTYYAYIYIDNEYEKGSCDTCDLHSKWSHECKMYISPILEMLIQHNISIAELNDMMVNYKVGNY
jgi:hypothetical protein